MNGGDSAERRPRVAHAAVGKGAVLYDTRDPDRRPCCDRGGRCLWHVTEVWTDTDGDVMYEVWDGTHTVREHILEDDLLYPGMFQPAGWQWPVGLKPTYYLSRSVGVRDHHDVMQEVESR